MIALVPIKENSERIPNKSFETIVNKPLFAFVIDSLIDSNFISKIVINTDSNKIISEIKKLYPSDSIQFIHRPKALRGDLVPMNDIIGHDINQFEDNLFIQTHITNPLLKTKTIDDAISFYKNNKYDSIVAVNEHKSRFYDHKHNPINHHGASNILRTQDLEPIYEENSCFYIFSKDSFINNHNNRIGNNPFYFTINKLESIDIDYYEDLELARALYKRNEIKK
jgi:CMP-N-acetylneuraminic acid synthetase